MRLRIDLNRETSVKCLAEAVQAAATQCHYDGEMAGSKVWTEAGNILERASDELEALLKSLPDADRPGFDEPELDE